MAIEISVTRKDEHGHLNPAKLVLDGDEAERYERDWANPNQPSGMYTGTVDGIVVTELVTFVKVIFT